MARSRGSRWVGVGFVCGLYGDDRLSTAQSFIWAVRLSYPLPAACLCCRSIICSTICSTLLRIVGLDVYTSCLELLPVLLVPVL
jgi:hypothetical protein